ncbi:MAG: hypothetical protein ACAI34_20575 [Verrucomicrobium sp.]|nr:hypothetical protein [Verrucomicrobium sp.]
MARHFILISLTLAVLAVQVFVYYLSREATFWLMQFTAMLGLFYGVVCLAMLVGLFFRDIRAIALIWLTGTLIAFGLFVANLSLFQSMSAAV